MEDPQLQYQAHAHTLNSDLGYLVTEIMEYQQQSHLISSFLILLASMQQTGQHDTGTWRKEKLRKTKRECEELESISDNFYDCELKTAR